MASRAKSTRIIFVTGTDTGVGKTLLTGLLVYHLRRVGRNALAVKPFCSGSRADARFLRAAQDNALTLDEINPFYFSEPVAPLVAAEKNRAEISLRKTLNHIATIAARCEVLLIEGAGGLMVPLRKNFFVRDLIQRLKCEVIVAASNRLGTINHTLLTLEALDFRSPSRIKVALMNGAKADASSKTNLEVLRSLTMPVSVLPIVFLGKNANKSEALKKKHKKVKKTLARFFI